jgi:hypothetical protein
MYLRLDEGAPTHRKTLAMCRILGNQEALMFMIRLWTWACRSSPRGDLTGTEPEDIEQIARWRGAPGAFYAAAVGVGFIEETPAGGRVLHDWEDWTGGDIEEMAAEARRKWWFRRHNATPRACGGVDGEPEPCPICLRHSSGGPSADGRRTSTVDKTRPGKTRQDKTRSRSQTDGREDSSVSGVAAGTPPSPAAPALLVFPTVRGKKAGPTEWHYTAELEAEFREYFPGLDVRAAVRAALAWVKAKEANRKTADGMRRFVTGWLNRAQNRGEHRLPSGSTQGGPKAAPVGGLADYCDWHKDARNDGKPSRRPRPTCPCCKELTARERVGSSDGPTSAGAIVDELPAWAGGNGVAR